MQKIISLMRARKIHSKSINKYKNVVITVAYSFMEMLNTVRNMFHLYNIHTYNSLLF